MRYFWHIGIVASLLPLLMAATETPDARQNIEPIPAAAVAVDWQPEHLRVTRGRLLEVAHSRNAQLRCLAQAVYFEARGESLEGQFAVAHVVLNRVENARYPDRICDVVFQNEVWRNRCQFSFACDGRSDRPRESRPWAQARLIAALTAMQNSGDLTGAATHYHAVYVQPRWAGRLQQTVKLGRHIFYRSEGY